MVPKRNDFKSVHTDKLENLVHCVISSACSHENENPEDKRSHRTKFRAGSIAKWTNVVAPAVDQQHPRLMSTSLIRRSAPDTSADRTAWQKAESRITEAIDRLSAQLQVVSQNVETLERKLTELEAVVAPMAASTTGHGDERTTGLARRFRRKVISLVREVFVGGLEKFRQETNREKVYMTLDR
jgi:hypothetical protein